MIILISLILSLSGFAKTIDFTFTVKHADKVSRFEIVREKKSLTLYKNLNGSIIRTSVTEKQLQDLKEFAASIGGGNFFPNNCSRAYIKVSFDRETRGSCITKDDNYDKLSLLANTLLLLK